MKRLLITFMLCSSLSYAKGGHGHASGHSSHVALHPAVMTYSAHTAGTDDAEHKAKNATGIVWAIGGALGMFLIYTILAEWTEQ